MGVSENSDSFFSKTIIIRSIKSKGVGRYDLERVRSNFKLFASSTKKEKKLKKIKSN